MQPKFALVALTSVSLTFIAVLPACSSSSESQPQLVGWRDLVAYHEPNLPGATPSLPSVEEMESIGGFAFVFPSYLPSGTGTRVHLSASKEVAGTAYLQPWEQVTIPPDDAGSRWVTIKEELESCNTPECVDVEHSLWDAYGGQTVGNTLVGCNPLSSPEPYGIECQWWLGDKWFNVSFRWPIANATPTDAMHEEVTKVVESMILAPEHP